MYIINIIYVLMLFSNIVKIKLKYSPKIDNFMKNIQDS